MPVDYSKMKVAELKEALKAKVMNDLPMFSMLQVTYLHHLVTYS